MAMLKNPLDAATAGRFARLVLSCIHREYPNKIAHVLTSDEDARPPRQLTLAFYGCFDWHSAVHGHWCLARLVRFFPGADWADAARAALERSLTPENLQAEAAYLSAPEREGFERPYGLAWLLQLAAELDEWDDPQARFWRERLVPLEQVAVEHLGEWLPKLTHPVRSGEHSQTAFAMGLCLDWARTVGESTFEELVRRRTVEFYGSDRVCPLVYEPSGHDFLSPALAEADLMRRVLESGDFAAWLSTFLPDLPDDGSTDWLEPVHPTDPSDGKLAHLDGLNLSRAWMLEGIVSGLPAGNLRIPALEKAAFEHSRAGLAAVTGEHYAGAHWLASFAVYLTTGRGLPSR